MKWDDVAYVLRSPLARKVLETLEDSIMTPVQISKKASMDRGNVSSKLTELRRRKLVECLNPDDKKFRMYKITEHGKKILKEAKKMHNPE